MQIMARHLSGVRTMSDQINDKAASRAEAPAETPFHAERELRPSSAGDKAIETKLQALSPDKPVVEAKNFAGLGNDAQDSVRHNIVQGAQLWEKMTPSIRATYDKMMRESMNGDQQEGDWHANYFSKAEGVLREVMSEISQDMDHRIAFPVQSFLPDAKGQMKAETLYAFYPPLNSNVNEKYITFPLHSTDPNREAQLRKNPSMANSISAEEQIFRFKVSQMMDRRHN